MASLISEPNGRYRVDFVGPDGRRKSIRLGKVTKRDAPVYKSRIEQLVIAKATGSAPSADTARWAADIGEPIAGRLERAGLIDRKRTDTVGGFINRYVESRKADTKKSTQAAWKAAHDSLIEHFGKDRQLRSITKGDALEWRRKIAKGRAENTVRKRTAIAKTLFTAALNHELIDRNPFDGLPSAMVENRDRMAFVTPADSEKVLKACPSHDWRCIFALARWGGLRCPSEVLALKWGDVLWGENRMVVTAPKTEHLVGKGTRIVPLFPELKSVLERAFDAAPDGAEFVVGKTRDTETNLRSQMLKIIKRAGVKPWPKTFQNLRSTRATELADRYPEHVATAWLGHCAKVAKVHYWQVTEDHFATASSADENPQHNPQQKAAELSRSESRDSDETSKNAGHCNSIPLAASNLMGDTGLEPVTSAV